MKHLAMTFVCALLCATAVMAQPRDGKRFSPQEFRQQMEQALTKRAQLTAEEATAVLPIFMEMKEKQRELQKQIGGMRHVGKQAPLSEEECASRVKKIKKLQVQLAEIEETYYKKMCSSIPASRVFRIMKADDQFHREMLSRFNGKKPEAGRGGQHEHRGEGRRGDRPRKNK